MTPETLRTLLGGVPENGWFAEAEARVRADPDAIGQLFARAGRMLGRRPLPDHPSWTAGQAGRVLLLLALTGEPLEGRAPEGAASTVTVRGRVAELYWRGDPAERLAVLHALEHLGLGEAGVPLIEDALRTNDKRLVAAALGPCAALLDDAVWRQGVVKCVFMEVPLSVVDRLGERADQPLAEMLGGLARERAAAGRRMPGDALALLNRQSLAKGWKAKEG
ncbi:EboA domain-containing protein [Winogradskya humida]|uniref:Ubiquinone biosynthesis protein COQ9 n=1 Tax=Winogradskya humida TaxID=113566 RepID=A0ABQ3ZHU2_9ACTN|nr:EboA domain-containing protein [Actinoplanes humidus]GIE18130.1 hypothetical protein Ahu01nite_012320 [Actinoplanes humidus]